jgi:hypothetical protein
MLCGMTPRLVLRTLLLLLAAIRLFAQATAVVQISGVVTDPNGGVIPAAQVKATQTGTGLVRTTATASDGVYVLPNLPVGPYRLEVSSGGFRTSVQTGIVLQVNTNPAINVTLQVGSVTQEIEVVANAGMVESQSNAISQVIDERRVQDLPLNGRQPTQLILLSGAAIVGPQRDFASTKNYPSSTAITVAGGQTNGTYYLLDGGDHNDGYSSTNLPLPFPDVLQEFSVQTNAIPSAYGIRAGAVVNAVSKSGTNQLHGSLFEFMRQGVTNARNTFAPRRDDLKRHQYGATVGGPLVRDRLFLFGGYQGTSIRTAPPTSTVFVPTAAVLAGDFSTVTSSACGTARALRDPANNNTPFPNNFISPSRFNQQALNFLKYVPASQDPCGRLLFAIPNNTNEDQFLARSDFIHNARHSIFGRYYFTDYRNPAEYDGQNILLTNRAGQLARVQSLTLGDTYSVSSSAINSFHFTWSRDHITRGPAEGLPSAADIGLQVAPSPGNFPHIVVGANFSSFCGICSLAYINSSSMQFADDFSLVKGRHQLTLGVNLMHRTSDFQVSTQQNAAYTFNGQITNDPTADLMLGRAFSFTQGNLTQQNQFANYFSMYAEDKIRLNPRLSLNLGLRWEPYFPSIERYGRGTHFELGAFLAGQKSTKFTNAPPGLFFPGDPGMPSTGGPTNRAWKNFAPRLGLVWDPKGNGRSSVRASYGILYDVPGTAPFVWFGFGPPWANTVTLNAPVGGFTDPFAGQPGGNPYPQPSPPPSDAVFVPNANYYNAPIAIRTPYMQQWNLSIQRQLGEAWLVTANYLGNRSLHRWTNRASNPAVYVPGACGSGPCSTTTNTPSRRLLARQSPAGAGVGAMSILDDGAATNYNAMLFSVNRRLSRNFSLLANYTWSHCIGDGDGDPGIGGSYQNPEDRRAEYGNCENDVRQLFNTSLLAVTPRFAGLWNNRLFGNWEMSGIITKRTGLWFNVLAGRDNSLRATNADRPDVVGDPKVANPSSAQWFDPAAFQLAPAGSFGNSGRNNIEGPGGFTFDVALMRYFQIIEGHRLQVRAEAFNVLNHPVYNNPRNSMADVNIGRILTANDPRIMQFALKYVF